MVRVQEPRSLPTLHPLGPSLRVPQCRGPRRPGKGQSYNPTWRNGNGCARDSNGDVTAHSTAVGLMATRQVRPTATEFH
ncbi:hypothetical protein BDV10DRAFT_48884 [Aspergillus recurvatus]